ncbi:hypothetical protein B0H14DRAFT_2309197, partial [Mycena olivaceomarginata]
QIRSDETCGDLLAAVPYYRTYSSTLISHSYTTDVPALNGGIIQSGYPLQTVAGLVFVTQEVSTPVPFYRLFNAAAQDTFYTISESERLDFITNQGYTDVEIAAYL